MVIKYGNCGAGVDYGGTQPEYVPKEKPKRKRIFYEKQMRAYKTPTFEFRQMPEPRKRRAK